VQILVPTATLLPVVTGGDMGKKRKMMKGNVQKIIRTVIPGKADKAEISIDEAEELYREIRIDNVLTDEQGGKAHLKPGAKVNVTVEADSSATTKKPEH
jgi:hypothetical protein